MKTSNQEQLNNKINQLDFNTLNEVWKYTETKLTNQETYIIRESIMSRLQSINFKLFEKWLDSKGKDLIMFKGVI